MKREFLTTADGSVTIHLPEWDEQYHSKHGAIAEAKHVFIEAGLRYFHNTKKPDAISVLEIGFGTGLNAFISLLYSEEKKIPIFYTGVEAFPIVTSEINRLNYPKLLGASEAYFATIHSTAWEKNLEITSHFKLLKRQQEFAEITDKDCYNVIYFDAFGARVQPELWTEVIFQKMYKALKNEGVLVTYAAKGSVRRAMQAVGFEVERLPGPPGKREMLRAIKHN